MLKVTVSVSLWRLTPPVSSAPLARLFLFPSVLVFWSQTKRTTSGRGRHSLRDHTNHWLALRCVGARETCCLATTAPLSSGCDGDVLDMVYACVSFGALTFPCQSCALTLRLCPGVCVCVCVKFISSFVWVLCLWGSGERRERRGGRTALHHPLSRPFAPVADFPRLC